MYGEWGGGAGRGIRVEEGQGEIKKVDYLSLWKANEY